MNVLQTLTHEIGHIFGLRHCQWLSCLMQGSNHLEEADQLPLNLTVSASCGVLLASTLRKKRYEALVRWVDDETANAAGVAPKHRQEDSGNLPKPVEAFKE